ncbi:hypothetical protein DM01DRAFT_1334211 [Hesseltinella vesiculosa]|uniref:Thioredoxin domain-containing protein n=1 Tax=Hesseltinella vesiculosa TaxID=101127 RepID=A0A1X2GN98_9FUNG|nr:hypothetical protein DM01DRAFT_1334211 [Hesseltinella vesiculosa]
MASTAEELSSVMILYAKVLTTWSLYSHFGLWWAALYLCGWFLLSSVVPQPWYRGPSRVAELTESAFRSKVQQKSSQNKIVEIDPAEPKYWVVMLYANWSITCLNFEAVLAHLSLDYTTDQVKFGKIDVDVFSDVAQEFAVSRDPASFDLPTLILFQHGLEIHRLPELSLQQDQQAKDTITRLGWSKSSSTVIRAFQLDKISGKP